MRGGPARKGRTMTEEPRDRRQPVVCNFRAPPEAEGLLAARSAAARAALHGTPGEALHALCDLRPLHGAVFAGLAPPGHPDAAGTYRGTPGSSVEGAARAVFLARRLPGLRHRDLCLAAGAVPAAMTALAHDLAAAWHARPGLDDPWRDAGFRALADLTARFFAVHPFVDGNGLVWRLALGALAPRLGLEMRAGWSVDRRPYGPEFSMALQWHADHPAILADQLRRWMRPVGPGVRGT